MANPFSMNLRAKALGVALSSSTSPLSYMLRVKSLNTTIETGLTNVYLAAPTVAENTVAGTIISGILGSAPGATLSLADSDGSRFAIVGSNLLTGSVNIDYEAGTTRSIIVRQTLGGQTLDTPLTISVTNAFEQPNLGALGFSSTTFNIGTASSGAITGATPGSTISATGLPSGLTINSAARTWSWSGTGTAGTSSATLTETLADSANSPRTTSGISLTVAAGAVMLPYTLIYDFETLGGATGDTGALVTLDTSSRKTLNGAGLRIQCNGVNYATIRTNYFLATNFDFSTVNTVAVCLDLGDFYSNDLIDVRWDSSLGHSLRAPADPLAGLNAPLTPNSLGKVWTSTTVDNYRRLTSTTCTTTSGSPTITVPSSGGLSVGMYAIAAGIPSGTTIQSIAGTSITLTANATASASGVAVVFSLTNDARGQSIKDLGATSKTLRFGTIASTNSSPTPDVVVDAFVAVPDSYLPDVLITFDDGNASQYDVGRALFASYGIKGNLYIPQAVIGTASKMTWDNLRTLKAEGWGMCIDSEGADLPITAKQTLAESITTLNNDKTPIIAQLGATGNALEHLCYSYGNIGYTANPVTYTCSSDGAAKSIITVTTAGQSQVFASMAPGMRIFVGGVVVGIVEALLDQKVFRADRQIAAGSYTMTFSARVFNLTATCNGTTTVTLSSTANLFPGMHLLANPATGLLPDTRIVSINSGTQITVDKAVPSTVTKVECGYVDGEYWPTKVMKGLYDAGYRTARRVGPQNGALFTGFGPSPYQMLQWGPLVVDNNTTTDATIAQIRQNAAEKRDTLLYGHNIQLADVYVNGDPAQGIDPTKHWPRLLQAIKDLQDTGKVRPSRGFHEYWADVSTRPVIS